MKLSSASTLRPKLLLYTTPFSSENLQNILILIKIFFVTDDDSNNSDILFIIIHCLENFLVLYTIMLFFPQSRLQYKLFQAVFISNERPRQ